jgi:DNA-binding response OmpR family regulator
VFDQQIPIWQIIWSRLIWPPCYEKILILEDDQRIAQNISLGLQNQGYQTELANDGLDGQHKTLPEDIDLVILDINLPSLNGLEVGRFLRQTKPHLPIIMLTALGEIENKVAGLNLG